MRRNLQILRIFGTTLIVANLLITSGVYISYRSFNLGVYAKEHMQSETVDSNWIYEGENSYQYLGGRYKCAGIFLAGSLLGWFALCLSLGSIAIRRFLLLTEFAAVLVVANQVWWILSEKALRSHESFWQEPYDYLMRVTYPLDWVLMVFLAMFLIVLCLLQIASGVLDAKKR